MTAPSPITTAMIRISPGSRLEEQDAWPKLL
jgi:hypothetical protein